MTHIKVFFEPRMLQKNSSFSPSSYKPLSVVNDWVIHYSDNIDIVSFNPLSKEQFYLAHDKAYVDGVFNGTINNGFGVKDKNFSTTFLYTAASLYEASLYALEQGLAVSPTSGFHHARYNKSEGFCTFNALVLSAMLLKQKKKIEYIGILDFDMHYGNGTDELIKKHKLNYIVHYTAGKKYDIHFPLEHLLKPFVKFFYNRLFTPKNNVVKKPVLRQKMLKNKGKEFLDNLPFIMKKFEHCDLLIYQAGADQHINDPYGGLLTTEELIVRDEMVFKYCKNHHIPIVWNLAGGYQKDSLGSIDPVLLCHRNTMKACMSIYMR